MDKRQIETFYPLTLAVRRLFHKLAHAASTLHADSDLSVGARAVLESVIESGPQTVPQMARVRPVTRQHIQGLVNALLEGGYVAYVDNPAHKRSKLVAPTERGRQAFAALRVREHDALKGLRLAATPEELEAATRVLRALIAGFDSPEWQAQVEGRGPDADA